MTWTEQDLRATVARMAGVPVDELNETLNVGLAEEIRQERLNAMTEDAARIYSAVEVTSDTFIPNPLAALPDGWATQVAERVTKARTTLRYVSATEGVADSATMARLAAATLLDMISGTLPAALVPEGWKNRHGASSDFRATIVEVAAMLAIAVDAFDAEVAEQREVLENLIAKGVPGGDFAAWKHQIGIVLQEEDSVASLVRWLRENVGAVGADFVLIHGAHSRAFTVFLKDERKAGMTALRWGGEGWKVIKEG
jgi:hypothetical protein